MPMTETRCTLVLCSLIMLAGALPVVGATEPPGNPDGPPNSAICKHENELAEQILKQMMSDSVDVREDPTAHELLGDAYQAQGRIDKATREYLVALELAEAESAFPAAVPHTNSEGLRAAIELSKLFSTFNVNGVSRKVMKE